MFKQLRRARLALGAGVLGLASVAGLALVPSPAHAAAYTTAYTTGPAAYPITGSEKVEVWGPCSNMTVWGLNFVDVANRTGYPGPYTLVDLWKQTGGPFSPLMVANAGFAHVVTIPAFPGQFYLQLGSSLGPGTYYASAEDAAGYDVYSGPATCS